ncbi:adenylosuccinate synthetase [Candidatus Pacearchaeota archaeon]|nr:adenylosuccinate synthetase [Candidatus Pacearchaeota archaeon]
MSLDDLVKGVQTIAVVCNQWGDTGKGKFSDYFASQWADVTARGTGGNNAGHTVVVNGRRKVFHLIPAGIASDSAGKITVLGNGMVIDLGVLGQELDELDAEKNSYNNLMISKDAGVIMPYHVAADKEDKSQKDGGIGTTGRGIGPCYTDKVARRGITIEDLFDKDRLSKKIERAKKAYPKQDINTDDVIDILIPLAERIRPFVRDTVSEMHRFLREGKKILLEGAQGLLLSVEHGIHPYVTSSDCSLNGTASGVGLSAKMIDLPLGIIKFPLMTRVGAGPFPTEIGGADSESYCSKEEHTLIYELITYGIPHQKIGNEIIYDKNDPRILEMINSSSEFIQGVGLRLAAREYGATTGRPRRIGWVDAVAARYAVGINGPLLVLTKPDSLSDAKEFKIAYGYEKEGKTSKTFSKSEKFLRGVTPIYKTYDGYGDISQIKEYDKLPLNLKQAIGDFESFTGGRVAVVSVGSDREETIIR